MHRPNRPIRRPFMAEDFSYVGLNTSNVKLDGHKMACSERYDSQSYRGKVHVGLGFVISGSYFHLGKVIVMGTQTHSGITKPFEMSLTLPSAIYNSNLDVHVDGENIMVTCSQNRL